MKTLRAYNKHEGNVICDAKNDIDILLYLPLTCHRVPYVLQISCKRYLLRKQKSYCIIRSITNRRKDLICYECKIINLFALCIELLEVNICELAKVPE